MPNRRIVVAPNIHRVPLIARGGVAVVHIQNSVFGSRQFRNFYSYRERAGARVIQVKFMTELLTVEIGKENIPTVGFSYLASI